jgi:hypothetical protein
MRCHSSYHIGATHDVSKDVIGRSKEVSKGSRFLGGNLAHVLGGKGLSPVGGQRHACVGMSMQK